MRRYIRMAALVMVCVMASGIWPHRVAADMGAGGSLAGRTIVLDAGHGDGGDNVYAGYSEGKAMYKLALKIKALLEARGATVHLTRKSADDVSLHKRAAMVNQWALALIRETRTQPEELAELDRLIDITKKIISDPEQYAPIYMNAPYSSRRTIHPDWEKILLYENDPAVYSRMLLISLHSNATGKPYNAEKNGADVYVASNGDAGSPNYFAAYTHIERSSYFAGLVLDGIHATGIKKRKVIQSNLLMVREHNVPGVLVENGFHTNPQDRARLQDDAFLDKLAQAYADATVAYFYSVYASVTPQVSAGVLSDVKDTRYWEAVVYVTEQALIPAISETIFFPDGGITRARLTDALYKLDGNTDFVYKKNPFSDVFKNVWFGMAAGWAAEKGILRPGLRKFDSNSGVSREETAYMIYQYMKLKGYELTDGDIPGDVDAASPWAAEAVAAVLAAGVMDSDYNGCFNPQSMTSRAEAALAIWRLAQISASDTPDALEAEGADTLETPDAEGADALETPDAEGADAETADAEKA